MAIPTFQAQLIEKLKPQHTHHKGGFAPLNNTLGFEKIAIVSTGTAWRLDGLLKAAKYTHVDLEVPLQPPWSDDEVDVFRGKGVPGRAGHIGRGQARCWLGHLNIWREMIAQNWATVLVMEDDADWDVAVKQQLLRVSPLIRQVSGDKGQVDWSPYGKAWDLLWLGHCGDYIPESPASLMDETLPESSLYRENDGRLTNFPSHLRMVHKSVAPICTYAYALTMPAASKLYELSRQGIDRIITDYLREWCQSGTLRCLTVNPEVFHHHKQAGEVSSDIAVVEGWDDLAAKAKSDYTANIRFSARCSSNAGRPVACQNEFGGVM
ncbi:hypothetical protein BDV24DRAFT_150316 [Aspergillus arachidicola]|uniref:Glycosyl transferase family 25 domain-containing protein n=1 Tax=Aspergillus arachidicola TaxID=656916 RepID=A0A5N6YGL9_9EURO|nr:hypothetical protein BDV24DRAFT_150316 [Aspergillus arachidicola]